MTPITRMKRPLLALAVATAACLALQLQVTPAHASFKLLYATNFGGGSIKKSIWTIYKGKPRCCNSRWAPSHVTSHNGILTIDASRDPSTGEWTSGGLSMGRSINRTYGAWSFRFKMDKGVGVKMCALLWPHRGWPPEIDFAENSSSDGARREITSTLHFSSRNRMVHRRRSLNYSKWHTMGVRWTPHKLVYRLDGRPWAKVTSHIPSRPMHLGIQTTVGRSNGWGTNPDSTTPNHVGLYIDWVRVWRWVR
jgi:beta-glucanase (GH16 family)